MSKTQRFTEARANIRRLQASLRRLGIDEGLYARAVVGLSEVSAAVSIGAVRQKIEVKR